MNKVERKSMINVRGGFSEDMGFNPCNTKMQIDDLDDKTRTLIGNQLFSICSTIFDSAQNGRYNFLYILKPPYNDSRRNFMGSDFCRSLLSNVFGRSVRRDPDLIYPWKNDFTEISQVILEAPYNEVFDILWFTCNWISRYTTSDFSKGMYTALNSLFEEEYVGYRFIAGKIVPITDKTEMQEIEK